MMQRGYENRYQVEMVSTEDLVPQNHLLKQISEAVDFSKIYEFVEELYCDDNGRPSIDSVIIFIADKIPIMKIPIVFYTIFIYLS